MEKITIKKNSLGDSRTAAHVPSREEFNESNNGHRSDVSNLMNAYVITWLRDCREADTFSRSNCLMKSFRRRLQIRLNM